MTIKALGNTTNVTTTSLSADIKLMVEFLKTQGYQLDVTSTMFPLRIVCPERGGLAGLRYQHGRWTYLLVFDLFFQPGEKAKIELHLQQAIEKLSN
jgi:hypothetical protein